MNNHPKMTLDELLKRKEQIIASRKVKKRKDLYIESIDAVITIEEPTAALYRDAVEMDPEDADKYMCFECIKEPNLKSKEVQEAFGCAVPMDIVDMIFLPGEIAQISVECIRLAGYGVGVKEVKN